MLAGERFEPALVEPAGRHDHPGVALAAARLHERHDAVDVVFDVDAGLLLELGLAVLAVVVDGVVQLLTQLGLHQVAHVGVGHDRRLAGT